MSTDVTGTDPEQCTVPPPDYYKIYRWEQIKDWNKKDCNKFKRKNPRYILIDHPEREMIIQVPKWNSGNRFFCRLPVVVDLIEYGRGRD